MRSAIKCDKSFLSSGIYDIRRFKVKPKSGRIFYEQIIEKIDFDNISKKAMITSTLFSF